MSLRNCELRIAALAGLGLAAAACANPDEPTLADAGEAVVACSVDPETIPETVTWSSPDGTDTCQGRYRYDRFEYCTYTNDPACEECAEYKSCVQRTPQVDSSTSEATYTDCYYDPVSGHMFCDPDVEAAESWCLAAQNARSNQIDSSPNKDVTSASRQLLLIESPGTFRCDVTVHYELISYSRRPECGCETYASCSLVCGLETAYSEPGLSRNQVLALPDAADPDAFDPGDHPKYSGPDATLECTTGEDILSNDFEAKFDRVREPSTTPRSRPRARSPTSTSASSS